MRRRLLLARPRFPTRCAVLMALLLLAGALIWYRPALTVPHQPVAEVPAPPAMFVATQFSVAGHQRACMSDVTVTPQSQLVEFQIFHAKNAKGGGPPVAFTLDGSGYHASAVLTGGYPGGTAVLPLTPPKRALITTACFHNLGTTPVFLVGTDEARSISRSHPVMVHGRSLPGDVAFSFLQSKRGNALGELGQLFQHVSDLTDGMLPPASLWLIAFVTAFGVPTAMILALRAALQDHEHSAN